jgi:hypothetical protein
MNFGMPILKIPQKPKIFWAFLFSALLPLPSYADFFDEQVVPVQERAFDTSSQKILAAGLGSVWLTQSLDGSTRDQWKDHQTMDAKTASYGDNFGKDAIGPLIALGQLYFDHDNGVSHARALIYTAGVTELLKVGIQRQRPNGSDHYSMPSGHTSTAFATATALTYSYGWKAAAVAYPLATFVGMTRMADDMHWLSDTVAGAFIGIWMGRAASYAPRTQNATASNYVFIPIVQMRFQGLNFQMDF